MSPDTIKQVRADYEAGESYRTLADRYGTSKSAVGRMAQEHGWAKGKQHKPAKAKPTKTVGQKRDSGTDGTVGQQEVSHVSQPPVPDDSPTIQERLDLHTKVATRGAKACHRLLERGEAILASGTTDSTLLHACAAMIPKAMNGLEIANRIVRLNAGLPTSYEKGETKTEGTLIHEHHTAERARSELAREFGLWESGSHLDGTQRDAAPVSVGVPDEPAQA